MLGRWIYIILGVCVIGIGCAADDQSAEQTPSSDTQENADQLRIIPLGGSITETVYALGFGENIVAVDISSTWPTEATTLPQVGYQRTLSAENILALNPSIIIASTEAGPPTAIKQLREAGVQVVIVPGEPTVESIQEKITGVANALGVPEKGKELVKQMQTSLAEAEKEHTAQTTPPARVLFIYSRGSGSIHVSGTNTSADLMITLAGAENAVVSYEGFHPLTAEGVVQAAPDVILLPSKGLEMLGGVEGVLKVPGIGGTPAGKNRKIVHMDDLFLLGLGPRTGNAVQELSRILREEKDQAIAGNESE